jgi:integral membrane protein
MARKTTMSARMIHDDDTRIAAIGQLRQLEIASLAEAVTLAVLVLVAVPLKHLGGWDLGVRLVGPVHGFAFVAYLWNVWQAGTVARWRGAELARLAVCALIPLGGFLNWPWLVRQTSLRVRAIASAMPAAQAGAAAKPGLG